MTSANTLSITPTTLPVTLTTQRPAYTKEITIESGQKTPFVKFHEEKGILMIKGNATEEEFHMKLISLVTLTDEYLKENAKLTCFFLFSDFNCSTCKILFSLFKMLNRHHNADKKIRINWFADHENTEMIDTGLDFAALFDLKFNIQSI